METERIEKAFRAAFATKGKNAGRLLTKCPLSTTDAAAAWQACMMHANPYKVGIMTTVLFSSEQREIYDWVYNALEAAIAQGAIDIRRIDRDRFALESLGVW